MQAEAENIFRTGEEPVFYADQSLEQKTAGACDLFLLLSRQACQLSLKEIRTGRILALEIIPSGEKRQHGWKALLEQLSARSQILRNHEFIRATAALVSREYTLVPDSLLRPGDENVYWKSNFPRLADLSVHAGHLSTSHLYSLFGIPGELEKELHHLFQSPSVMHHSMALISGMNLAPGDGFRNAWVNIHSGQMDVLVTEKRKLIFLNSFPWQTNEDILYHSLFVCEQMEINPNKSALAVSGLSEAGTPLHVLLKAYFRSLLYLEKPDGLKIPFSENDFPFHRYANLYFLSLCE